MDSKFISYKSITIALPFQILYFGKVAADTSLPELQVIVWVLYPF